MRQRHASRTWSAAIALSLAACSLTIPEPGDALIDGAPPLGRGFTRETWLDSTDPLDRSALPDESDPSISRRMEACLDDQGIDFFAVAGDAVLSLSWNHRSGAEAKGGYDLRVNGQGLPSRAGLIPCAMDACEIILRGPLNGERTRLSIDALDEHEKVIASSCTLEIAPRPLSFGRTTTRVPLERTPSSRPAIAGGRLGEPLAMVWETGSGLVIARSDDRGETWSPPERISGAGAGARSPDLVLFESAARANEVALLVAFAVEGEVRVVQGTITRRDASRLTLAEAIALGPGDAPAIAARSGLVVVAFEDRGRILATRSWDGGASFFPPERVDRGGAADIARAPSIVIDDGEPSVFVAYEGHRGRPDPDIYVVSSRDGGSRYEEAEVRIDDGDDGTDQRSVTIGLDRRTGILSAAWADQRRGTTELYTALSRDGGRTFSRSVKNGASMAAYPIVTTVDTARNFHSVFVDDARGLRVMFSRSNPHRSFEDALILGAGSELGSGSMAAPAVFVDGAGRTYAVWTETNGGTGSASLLFSRGD